MECYSCDKAEFFNGNIVKVGVSSVVDEMLMGRVAPEIFQSGSSSMKGNISLYASASNIFALGSCKHYCHEKKVAKNALCKLDCELVVPTTDLIKFDNQHLLNCYNHEWNSLARW